VIATEAQEGDRSLSNIALSIPEFDNRIAMSANAADEDLMSRRIAD
jgi:hypothetical protein